MNYVATQLIRAIHEGKWISIEYRNAQNDVTNYWIAVRNIDAKNRTLLVDGLHVGELTYKRFENPIKIDGILSANVVDGTFAPINQQLVDDIFYNPGKYKDIFGDSVNLKILNYLLDCYRMDSTPYLSEVKDSLMVKRLDEDVLIRGQYQLDYNQFAAIVKKFQINAKSENEKIRLKALALNVLSIDTKNGLYVLAYKKLRLDVQNRAMKIDDELIINREFLVESLKKDSQDDNKEFYRISRFLDEEDQMLLEDFNANREKIKDAIKESNRNLFIVDEPLILGINNDCLIDLNSEYKEIMAMYNENRVSYPIKAFFGELKGQQEKKKKNIPITLLNRKVNLDQLLAINNAMKYSASYVQGPPGSGKTNTIINAIITAFFNEKTVLFSSYNNHPIDGVYDKFRGEELCYRGKRIPFPIIRLGNASKMSEALKTIRTLYEQVKDVSIYEDTLGRNKQAKEERMAKLAELLKLHEEKTDLLERKDGVETLLEKFKKNFRFSTELQSNHLHKVNDRLKEIGDISNDDALNLLDENEDEFKKYLYYTSAKYIKRLGEPKNKELYDIIYCHDEKKQEESFRKYLSSGENLNKFLRIFPIIITTIISAHKLGEPKMYFDITIIDEASQCNNAVSLVPIIRGENLMLVGDPQQLSPVIVLDPQINTELRKKYCVSSVYDYIDNSIYKCYQNTDPFNEEVLLRYHYRCNEKIIQFNNKKYYNKRLIIKSESEEPKPLTFIDIPCLEEEKRNTSVKEAEAIAKFILENKDRKIGIITPFVRQKEMIGKTLAASGLENIPYGTVHTFQGDEKDVILFSLALTENTSQKTYNWLKENRELINVATSRPKEKLVILGDSEQIKRLSVLNPTADDLLDLCKYVQTNGITEPRENPLKSKALGFKPFSTDKEQFFLNNLEQALSVMGAESYRVQKEVPIKHVFKGDDPSNDLFYTGVFDFVIYDARTNLAVLAIELDGHEHEDDARTKIRDQKKQACCDKAGLKLIRIENCYARRYNTIKQILLKSFGGKK